MRIVRLLAVLTVLSALLRPSLALADQVVVAESIRTAVEPKASGGAFFGPGTDPGHRHEELGVQVQGDRFTDTIDFWLDGAPFATGIGLTKGQFAFDQTDLGYYRTCPHRNS